MGITPNEKNKLFKYENYVIILVYKVIITVLTDITCVLRV